MFMCFDFRWYSLHVNNLPISNNLTMLINLSLTHAALAREEIRLDSEALK